MDFCLLSLTEKQTIFSGKKKVLGRGLKYFFLL